MRGVVRTHHPLQLRELADHVGQQVSLCQTRRAHRVRGIGAELAGQKARQALDAQRLVGECAKTLFVHHAVERRGAVDQRALAVGVPEIAGVGQPRAQHALVAGAHALRLGAVEIGDGDEVRQQLAVGIQHMEVLLVVAHGGDQHRRRHFQKTRVERARDCYRPLHQRRHLVQQRLVQHRLPTESGGGVLHALRHAGTAVGKAGDDVRGGQASFVLTRVVDGDRLRVMKAVSAAGVAGRETEARQLQHLPAVQRDQPVHRAHELAVLAVAPAHAPVDGQRLERRVEQARQDHRQRVAGLHGAVHQPGAFVSLHGLQRRHVHAAGLRKAEQRPRRLAIGVECCLHRRAPALHLARRRRRPHVRHAHGEAPRACEQLAGSPCIGETGFDQALQQALAKRRRQRGERPRRQLLGADLDQQRAHHAASVAGAT